MSVVAMPVARERRAGMASGEPCWAPEGPQGPQSLVGLRAQRPTLRLVPAGPAVRPVARSASGAAWGPGVAAGAQSWRAGGLGRALRPEPVRLTRRGRLLRTLAVFGAACLLLSLALARLSAPGPLVADHAVTVEPGQTLTQIARTQLPQWPLDRSVAALRELNGMNSTVVVAGQSLLIPAS